jgi:class 3 adenylate cyclase/FixJ family two-component response regulator
VATISVFLADDNLLVRAGVRALLGREPDVDVVGEASDYDELVRGAVETQPQVVVSDIRMPPSFQREGIDAAKEIRKRNPGTGVVILSQYDDPDYAVALLSEGAAGYAYLLKDRLAEGDQLIDAVRSVAAGGTALDPVIVDALVRPVRSDGDELSGPDEALLTLIAEGRPIKAIAAMRSTTAEAVADDVEDLFLALAKGASSGADGALRRLRMLHQAIVDREEQGETLSRLLPGGLAEKLRREGRPIGESEELEVTVLMSDIRSYSSIAERTPPTLLATQLNEHRAAMNRAVLGVDGTVMQFVGDAVMAVFGAPFAQPDHADRALAAAAAMHREQCALNARWRDDGREEFVLGIGLSTGTVAAALLGSEERVEYTLVGDTVNLAQRLQDLARPGNATVLSDATWKALTTEPDGAEDLGELGVKGRETPVRAWRVEAD